MTYINAITYSLIYFTILSINRILDKLQSKNVDVNNNTSKNIVDILTSLT